MARRPRSPGPRTEPAPTLRQDSQRLIREHLGRRRRSAGGRRPAHRREARHLRPAPSRCRVWLGVGEAAKLVAAGLILIVLTAPDAAAAGVPLAAPLAVASVDGVIDGLRTWIVSILVGLATLFLTIGGLRYLMAGGDPGEVEKAKSALRSAAIGYGLAVMAPVFVQILRQILGT